MENFTIIIPTYHEVDNIPTLAKRIADVKFKQVEFEVLLMDDNSNDGSVELVQELQQHYPWLKMIVRNSERNLSQSILDGFKAAQYPVVVTMDADLSHPPECIPEMITCLSTTQAEMVIGSRYIRGGSTDSSWPLFRQFASRASAWLARLLLLITIKDPLSGFIAIPTKLVLENQAKINPIGWKITLEIIVKCHLKNIREVPIHFTERARGYSKLNTATTFAYFHHLSRLLRYKLSHAITG